MITETRTVPIKGGHVGRIEMIRSTLTRDADMFFRNQTPSSALHGVKVASVEKVEQPKGSRDLQVTVEVSAMTAAKIDQWVAGLTGSQTRHTRLSEAEKLKQYHADRDAEGATK